jgi:hypothetical protein
MGLADQRIEDRAGVRQRVEAVLPAGVFNNNRHSF